MDLEVVRRLIPSLRRARYVHLQGWGEPLCHPRFFEILREVKGAGCGVGTTTNGMLIGRKEAEALVSGGIDLVSFSLAGIDETNDRIRVGTRIRDVLAAVDHLREIRSIRGYGRPRIHVAYLLLRSGLGFLDDFPDFFAGIGADEVVVSSLSLVPSRVLEEEAVLARDEREWSALLEKAEDVAARSASQGITFQFHLQAPGSSGTCMENVGRSLVVGFDGSVFPCVMLGLPVSKGCLRIFYGKEVPIERVVFGDVHAESVEDIWRKVGYRSFRKAVNTDSPPPVCQTCLKRWTVVV